MQTFSCCEQFHKKHPKETKKDKTFGLYTRQTNKNMIYFMHSSNRKTHYKKIRSYRKDRKKHNQRES